MMRSHEGADELIANNPVRSMLTNLCVDTDQRLAVTASAFVILRFAFLYSLSGFEYAYRCAALIPDLFVVLMFALILSDTKQLDAAKTPVASGVAWLEVHEQENMTELLVSSFTLGQPKHASEEAVEW
jgi:hypothetical protein